MKTSNKILLSSALAVAVAGIGTAQADAEHKMKKEKCYGVAKAGKNDCGGKFAGHSCAGEGTKDADGNDFIALPIGLCEKLAGGSLAEAGEVKKEGEDE